MFSLTCSLRRKVLTSTSILVASWAPTLTWSQGPCATKGCSSDVKAPVTLGDTKVMAVSPETLLNVKCLPCFIRPLKRFTKDLLCWRTTPSAKDDTVSSTVYWTVKMTCQTWVGYNEAFRPANPTFQIPLNKKSRTNSIHTRATAKVCLRNKILALNNYQQRKFEKMKEWAVDVDTIKEKAKVKVSRLHHLTVSSSSVMWFSHLILHLQRK